MIAKRVGFPDRFPDSSGELSLQLTSSTQAYKLSTTSCLSLRGADVRWTSLSEAEKRRPSRQARQLSPQATEGVGVTERAAIGEHPRVVGVGDPYNMVLKHLCKSPAPPLASTHGARIVVAIRTPKRKSFLVFDASVK